jgi:hypothetical protein
MAATVRQELEQHLINCGNCLGDIDAGGNIVPVSLCRTGRRLHFAYAWDLDVQDAVLSAMERDLAGGTA